MSSFLNGLQKVGQAVGKVVQGVTGGSPKPNKQFAKATYRMAKDASGNQGYMPMPVGSPESVAQTAADKAAGNTG